MRRERGDVIERRRMKAHQRLVHHCLNLEIEGGDVWAEDAHRVWEIQHVLPEYAALHRPRIANQIEVCVGLPTVTPEALSALIGRNRWICAGVLIWKHRVAVLVHRHVRTARGRRGRGGTLRLLLLTGATAARSCEQRSEDEKRSHVEIAHIFDCRLTLYISKIG